MLTYIFQSDWNSIPVPYEKFSSSSALFSLYTALLLSVNYQKEKKEKKNNKQVQPPTRMSIEYF